MIEIELADQQDTLAVDAQRLIAAVRRILKDYGPPSGNVSLAVVDDPTIHQLNRRYLQHDYATDVLSFVMEYDHQLLEGEVIVSSDTVLAQAERYGVAAADELLLYVIHGTLHLVGFDDKLPEKRQEMRAAERQYLAEMGADYRESKAENDRN